MCKINRNTLLKNKLKKKKTMKRHTMRRRPASQLAVRRKMVITLVESASAVVVDAVRCEDHHHDHDLCVLEYKIYFLLYSFAFHSLFFSRTGKWLNIKWPLFCQKIAFSLSKKKKKQKNTHSYFFKESSGVFQKKSYKKYATKALTKCGVKEAAAGYDCIYIEMKKKAKKELQTNYRPKKRETYVYIPKLIFFS